MRYLLPPIEGNNFYLALYVGLGFHFFILMKDLDALGKDGMHFGVRKGFSFFLLILITAPAGSH